MMNLSADERWSRKDFVFRALHLKFTAFVPSTQSLNPSDNLVLDSAKDKRNFSLLSRTMKLSDGILCSHKTHFLSFFDYSALIYSSMTKPDRNFDDTVHRSCNKQVLGWRTTLK